ncbi:MAG: pyrroline-5-carboxylate reductase [Selenomonas sp.]|uniref:pyrroline-5-carboxylate reductase n=1 Tax=Selenomonas sp. TaxID=2053611 RepID=UPI0025D8BEE4|nr:pyrroline-5-carboxylate reductase [Selenomonas sp.]MCI6100737.1 pyrroline-5-carboxylate reductase [Selenomonas sp.]MCI6231318.1 pyrroline-5-carboxylate reductase [Selenomonas sp.]
MKKLGFIGMGNMAQALALGFIESGSIEKANVFAYAPHQDKLKKNAQRIGFSPCTGLKELAEACDTLVMACKPYQIEDVITELKDVLPGKALVSIAAGWDFAHYEKALPAGVRVQFVMPNTPAMVGEGVLLFEETNSLEEGERKEIWNLFSSVGLTVELPSSLMGIGGTVTGCGPAFVDLFLEAYADAAVKYGMKRADAYRLISQMVLGSAKLQLATGEHPGVLKDNVCSPAGTTICGVTALEEQGFRNACIKSIDAIMNK